MSKWIRRSLCTLSLLLLFIISGCAGGDSINSPDGVPIAFDKVGDGDITLVFIHGWCCDRTYWRHQVAGLADQFTIVTLDLAGHGESGMQRQNYTAQAFGRDIAAVVNGLDLQNVYLVGHSMGGSMAVEAAALLGDRVQGIIGIDTLQEPGYNLTAQQAESYVGPMRADFPRAVDEFVRPMFPVDADTALVNQVVADMSSAPPEVALSALTNYFTHDLMSTLRTMDVPVWCIDANMYPIDFESWKFYRGGFTAVVMPGLGHFLFLEEPAGFNDELVQLVNRMESHPGPQRSSELRNFRYPAP